MSNLTKIILLIALLVIGPVMFTVARQNSLNAGFAKVHIGDSTEALRAAMGPPQAETRENLYLQGGDLEYRYSVWPLPKLWVVSLRGGKVLEKAQLQSP